MYIQENDGKTIRKSFNESRPDLALVSMARQNNLNLFRQFIKEPLSDKRKARLLGAVLGLAIGDILGCPVEGMSFQEINSRHHSVNTLLYPSYWKYWRLPGLHSDDSQQMLAILEALALARPNYSNLDQASIHRIGKKLAELFLEGSTTNSNSSFGCWRGTGSGFRNTVKKLARGKGQSAAWPFDCGEASAGLGAAMRIAPLGILIDEEESLARLTAALSLITHKDSWGIASAYVVAAACHLLRQAPPNSLDPEQFLERLAERAGDFEQNLPALLGSYAEFATNTDGAGIHSSLLLRLRELIKESPATAMRKIRSQIEELTGKSLHPTGGFGPSGVAACLYFFLHGHQDPEKAIFTSINAGGDTDTIGAIVGAFCGSLHTYSAFENFIPDLVALNLFLNKTQAVINPGKLIDISLIQEESLLTAAENTLKSSLHQLK